MLTEVFNIIGLQLTSSLSLRQKEALRKYWSGPVDFDSRLYSREGLGSKPGGLAGDPIAEENLTSSDLRILIQTEEELSQTKGFTRLLPSRRNSKYLKYLEGIGEMDLLLSSWEERYHQSREDGRQILSRLCSRGVHLQS